ASLDALIKRYEAFDMDKANYLNQVQKQLEQRIEGLYELRSELNGKLSRIKAAIVGVSTKESMLKETRMDLEQFIKDVSKHIQDLIHKGYDEEIKYASTELSETQALLHRSEMREGILKDIENEHKESVQWH